jgi:hypothetical protein
MLKLFRRMILKEIAGLIAGRSPQRNDEAIC